MVSLLHHNFTKSHCLYCLLPSQPANVLLDEWGSVVVSDFGISARLESTLSRLMPTSIKGTTCYMSPEAFDPTEFGGITEMII